MYSFVYEYEIKHPIGRETERERKYGAERKTFLFIYTIIAFVSKAINNLSTPTKDMKALTVGGTLFKTNNIIVVVCTVLIFLSFAWTFDSTEVHMDVCSSQ